MKWLQTLKLKFLSLPAPPPAHNPNKLKVILTNCFPHSAHKWAAPSRKSGVLCLGPETGSLIFQSWHTRSTMGNRQGQGATPGRQRWSPCTGGIARSGGRCCRPRTWSASWTRFLVSSAPRLWHPLLLLRIKGQKTLPWYARSPYSWEESPTLPERLFQRFCNVCPESQVWKVKGDQ